ncbi:MAG: ABC transporter substrate-binding protein [Bacillota bacterium]|nr:ABC transporter substrate-binding protein [Bacillota bacterium]
MRKTLAIILAVAMLVFAVSGCNIQTKPTESTAPTQAGATTTAPVKIDPIEVTVVANSTLEKEVNILRDQLTKAGFTVKINLQPDFSSYKQQIEAGNYDIAVSNWTTVTANPDYAVRSLFYSGSDWNMQKIENAELDRLIDEAATKTSADYVDAYGKVEKVLIDDNAYIAPLFSSYRISAINKDVIKEGTFHLLPSGSTPWQRIDFANEADRDTKPLLLTQQRGNLTSLDPIKGNDGSINALNSNIYSRLVVLDGEDHVVSDGSLTYNHAIGDGNSEYYFILRDNVNFAKVVDMHAVDSGERVGAEDVIFTLDRARDKNSVPDHRTFTLHSSIEKIEALTDLAELEKKTADGKTVLSVLSKDLPAEIKSLEADKTKVNNAEGVYQVVKITTNRPFPQMLNFLAHQSGGIVSEKQVKAVNTYDIATYDRTKDVAYGDQSTVTEGATYNNTLVTSGPYILVHKNDYEAVFERNPGYMPGTDRAPKIKTVHVKFIKDLDSALSALRSGDIQATVVPEDKVSLVEQDAKLQLLKVRSNGVTYAYFNLNEKSPFHSLSLRRAVLAAVNQEEFIAVYNNLKNPVYSTLTTIVNTGNVLTHDMNKVKEYLIEYQKEKK